MEVTSGEWPMEGRLLYLRSLRRQGMCEGGKRRFQAFPAGELRDGSTIPVTRENCRRAARSVAVVWSDIAFLINILKNGKTKESLKTVQERLFKERDSEQSGNYEKYDKLISILGKRCRYRTNEYRARKDKLHERRRRLNWQAEIRLVENLLMLWGEAYCAQAPKARRMEAAQ